MKNCHSTAEKSAYIPTRALHHSDLGDGEIQPDIDDHSEEQDVKGSNHQERLLQHQDFVEGVMNLQEKFQTLISIPCHCRVNSSPQAAAEPPKQSNTCLFLKCFDQAAEFRGTTHHDVLDVLLHQVALVCHNNRTSKSVQICVVKLI